MKHIETSGSEVLEIIGAAVEEWQKVLPRYAAATNRLFKRSPAPLVAARQEIALSINAGASLMPDEVLDRMGQKLERGLAEDLLTSLIYNELEARKKGAVLRTDARRANVRILTDGVKGIRVPLATREILGEEMDEHHFAILGHRTFDVPVGSVRAGRLDSIQTAPEDGGMLLLRKLPSHYLALTGLVDRENVPRVELRLS